MNEILTDFQEWFEAQCNGEWEHTHGVSIETLDNPGWEVKIDLKDTRWESSTFDELQLERAPNDWIHCKKEGAQFQGYGDPRKLGQVLGHFLAQVNRVNAKT